MVFLNETKTELLKRAIELNNDFAVNSVVLDPEFIDMISISNLRALLVSINKAECCRQERELTKPDPGTTFQKRSLLEQALAGL